MELFGCKGCGSAFVEAMLELAQVDHRREIFDWEDQTAWVRLREKNPLGQVPLLVLDDRTRLTETAGIGLWIANTFPAAGLLPSGASMRALAYRWMAFLATNVYGPVIIGDFPERWVADASAHAALKAGARERLVEAWSIFEAHIEPAPFVLGPALSLVDVYAAMLTRWRPGRAWFTTHCPKTMAAVALTERHPVVASVWSRNFG